MQLKELLYAFGLMTLLPSPAVSHDLVGVIDRTGRFVIPAKYERILYFGHGIFQCFPDDGTHILLNQPERTVRTSEELRSARNNLSYDLLDKFGQRIKLNIPSDYRVREIHVSSSCKDSGMTACQSSGTLITVSNADGIGVVNGEGHIVLPVKYYSVSIQGDTKVVGFGPPMRGQSSDEHVAFANATQLDSKLDASDPTLTLPESFSEGLGVFHYGHNYFVWPGHGTQSSPDYMGPDNEKREYVKYGYVDQSCKVVIPPIFFGASDFQDGVAAVRLNPIGQSGQCAYIDKSGRVISPTFWQTQKFSGQRAVVSVRDDTAVPKNVNFVGSNHHGRYGLINRDFKWVIEPEYCLVRELSDGKYFCCSYNDKPSCLMDRDGRKIFDLPTDYTCLEAVPGGYLATEPLSREANKLPPLFLDERGKVTSKFPEYAGKLSRLRLDLFSTPDPQT